MNWTDIQGSTAIARVGYDPETAILAIVTHQGKQYDYPDVQSEEFGEFMAEPSKGKAWAALKKAHPTKDAAAGNGKAAAQPAKAGKDSASDAASPVAVKADSSTPVGMTNGSSVAALAISFEAGKDLVTLPFEEMVTRLKTQMDEFCVPIRAEIDTLVNEALQVKVSDDETLKRAAQIGSQLATKRRYIEQYMKPTKRAVDSVKAVFLDKEKELAKAVGIGEDHLANGCTTYRSEQQRKERERVAAEQQRLQREAEQKRIADAEKHRNAGRTALADKLVSTPVTAPQVEERQVARVEGARGRVNYRFRGIDPKAATAEILIPLAQAGWLKLDEVAIGQYARDSKLPNGTVQNGIEFYQEEDTKF